MMGVVMRRLKYYNKVNKVNIGRGQERVEILQ